MSLELHYFYDFFFLVIMLIGYWVINDFRLFSNAPKFLECEELLLEFGDVIFSSLSMML